MHHALDPKMPRLLKKKSSKLVQTLDHILMLVARGQRNEQTNTCVVVFTIDSLLHPHADASICWELLLLFFC